MGYDGFISYSHSADGKLAPAVQTGLQRLAKPWNRRRALRLFRDETGLSTSPHLWSSIATALDESDWYILLASPQAASSEWVNREIQHWTATKPAERILTIVTDGSWSWDNGQLKGTAVPTALATAFTDEPRYLDLRWARTQVDLDLRNSRFRSALADLAAPMHGIPKDELEGEDIRQHRRTRRLTRAAFSVLTLLVVIALVATSFAVRQRNEAQRQYRLATVGRLVAESQLLASKQYDRSLLLAAEARRLDDSPATTGALLGALEHSPHLVRFLPRRGGGVDAASTTPDGQSVAVVGRDGKLRLVDAATGHLIRQLPTGTNARIGTMSFSNDGALLALGAADGTVHIVDVARGRTTGAVVRDPNAPGQSISAVTFSADGSRLATIAGFADAIVWDAASGRMLQRVAREQSARQRYAPDLAFTPDSRHLVVGSTPVEIHDLESGTSLLVPKTRALDDVEAVSMSPDGRALAIGYQSVTEIRDPTTTALLRPALPVGAVALAYSPDGNKLTGAHNDGSLDVWDLQSDGPSATHLMGHTAAPHSIDFGPDGNGMVTATNHEIAVWSLGARSTLGRALEGDRRGVNGVAVSPDGAFFAAARTDGTVGTWDARTFRPVGAAIPATTDLGFTPGAWEVAFSPDSRALAVTAWDGTLSLWNARTPRADEGSSEDHARVPIRGRLLAVGHVRTRLQSERPDRSRWEPATGRSCSSMPNGGRSASGSKPIGRGWSRGWHSTPAETRLPVAPRSSAETRASFSPMPAAGKQSDDRSEPGST